MKREVRPAEKRLETLSVLGEDYKDSSSVKYIFNRGIIYKLQITGDILMETLTSPLKDRFLDSVVTLVFEDIVKSSRAGNLPDKISLTGLDIASLTRASVDLGCKLKRHWVKVLLFEAKGAVAFDLGRYYGRAMARSWYKQHRDSCKGYVIADGLDSNVREGFVQELYRLAGIEAYSENQFPNSGDKIAVDLEELASSSRD